MYLEEPTVENISIKQILDDLHQVGRIWIPNLNYDPGEHPETRHSKKQTNVSLQAQVDHNDNNKEQNQNNPDDLVSESLNNKREI